MKDTVTLILSKVLEMINDRRLACFSHMCWVAYMYKVHCSLLYLL